MAAMELAAANPGTVFRIVGEGGLDTFVFDEDGLLRDELGKFFIVSSADFGTLWNKEK